MRRSLQTFLILVLMGLGILAYHVGLSTQILNPTNTDISITLDNESIMIPANGMVSKLILPGSHTVTFSGKTDTFFRKWVQEDFLFQSRKSILNPTHTQYIAESIVYGTNLTNIESAVRIDNTLYASQYGTFIYDFRGIYAEAHYLPGEVPPQTITVDRTS